jgi:hypothetical protein
MTEVTEELYREASAPWAKDPYEGIEVATRGFLRVFAEHRRLWRCLLEGVLQSPAIEQMWLDLRRNFILRIAHALAQQQARGDVRPFDPALAAHALGSMAEWFAFTHVVLDEPPATGSTDEVLARAAATLTDLWFNAVYGDAARSSSG